MNEPLATRTLRLHPPARFSLKTFFLPVFPLAALLLFLYPAVALERTNVVFKIFQFPPNMIPTIDGKANDWDIVPEDSVIGMGQLVDDIGKHPAPDHNGGLFRLAVQQIRITPCLWALCWVGPGNNFWVNSANYPTFLTAIETQH